MLPKQDLFGKDRGNSLIFMFFNTEENLHEFKSVEKNAVETRPCRRK